MWGGGRASVLLQVRVTPVPLAKKPGLQLHVPESAALTLLLGQAVHVDAPAGLNEPARQAVRDCRTRQRGGARLARLECAKSVKESLRTSAGRAKLAKGARSALCVDC